MYVVRYHFSVLDPRRSFGIKIISLLIYITMEAIKQEIRDELVRVRVDKVRLYNLLAKYRGCDPSGGSSPGPAPVAAPAPVEVKEEPAPVEVKEEPAPVEVKEEPAPVPVKEEKPKAKKTTTTKKKTTTRASVKKE
jgi:hypothetical protein